MDNIATENLFLLEFLVDNVCLDPSCDCTTPPGETCVSFQFLDNQPLNVCEADFNPKRTYGQETDAIKSGKSCLFSLTPEQANTVTQQFDVFVDVGKKMQPGWLPEKVNIGTAVISICALFVELICSIDTETGSSATAKTLKDDFDIMDPNQKVIGKIAVYIRMSCFGKLIVTQFQMNMEDKSVLFKDKEGKSLYRYKKAGKNGTKGKVCTARGDMGMPNYPLPNNNQPLMNFPQNNQNCPSFPCGVNGNMGKPSPQNNKICPTYPCGGGNGNGNMNQPLMNFPQNGMQQPPPNMLGGSNCPFTPCNMEQPLRPQTPCVECGQLPSPTCMKVLMPPTAMNDSIMSNPTMSPCLECRNYPGSPCAQPGNAQMFSNPAGGVPCQECGAITDAPCARAGFGPPVSPEISFYENTPCGDCANDPDAPCREKEQSGPPPGNYQEIAASMGGNSLTIRIHKDNKVETIDDDCTCGADNTEQNYSMRPGVPQNKVDTSPFNFKMGSSGKGNGNNITVNTPTCTAPDGTQFTELSDPNKETFILRIGKKSEGVDKKANLELELCTPRGPELKPIPKKDTKDTQYDPKDFPAGNGNGNGKGKKKK